ncbi:hypothetical protein FC98_GL001017 [Lentilactobacillus kisonensis DSM 19906 = JCM 15041]|uniref:Uncharacterized protein n=2 Tax=Lentilactobacillus kisonensis TaxID=481722 RepID=H1LGU3_9LACO|nr:hypothetical protein HMPREF9104_01822 [Lentilactobacillus kisonensis F0435]KRL22987.1 hypothetical protein FC98_GL001017 [Lentilactobacillus kisonensis DSM 19906 = JCM 15041]
MEHVSAMLPMKKSLGFLGVVSGAYVAVSTLRSNPNPHSQPTPTSFHSYYYKIKVTQFRIQFLL